MDAVAVGVFTQSTVKAYRRVTIDAAKEARSRGKSRRGGQGEGERVSVTPRLSLSLSPTPLSSDYVSRQSWEASRLLLLLPAYFLGSFITSPVASTAPAPPSCPESWSHAQDLGVICLKPKGESRPRVVTNGADGRRLIQLSWKLDSQVGPRSTGNITGASWVRDSALAFALPHSAGRERGDRARKKKLGKGFFFAEK